MFNQQHIRLKGENGVLSASTFISIRKVACREDHSAEYALPAVLVSNKNGRKRLLYQNYRKLNESLINPMQSDGSHGERVRQATGVQKTNTIHQIHHGSSKGAY